MGETAVNETPRFETGRELAGGFLDNFRKRAKPPAAWKILVNFLLQGLFSYVAAVTALKQDGIPAAVLYWALCAVFAGMGLAGIKGLWDCCCWRSRQDAYLLQWLQKHESKNPEIRYVLGYAYDTGCLGEKDPRLAVQWYEKAGSYPFAQNDLAIHYALGQGVGRDMYRARKLLKEAQRCGCFFAAGNLQTLETMR